jgi:hypothetical protein
LQENSRMYISGLRLDKLTVVLPDTSNRNTNLPTAALKISMELNKRACIGNIIMRDVGKFTQSKPGNRFRAPMGAVSGEVLYVPVSAPNCGVLCNANEKQKIANRQ